jgi:hypothetical protein
MQLPNCAKMETKLKRNTLIFLTGFTSVSVIALASLQEESGPKLLNAMNTTDVCRSLSFGTTTNTTIASPDVLGNSGRGIVLGSGYTATNFEPLSGISSLYAYTGTAGTNALRLGDGTNESSVTFSFAGLMKISAVKITAYVASSSTLYFRNTAMAAKKSVTVANTGAMTLSDTVDSPNGLYTLSGTEISSSTNCSGFTLSVNAGVTVYIAKIVLTTNSYTAFSNRSYSLVTSASQLVAGKRYMLATMSSGSGYVMGDGGMYAKDGWNYYYRPYHSATVSNSTITWSSNFEELTLGQKGGYYYFATNHSENNSTAGSTSGSSYAISTNHNGNLNRESGRSLATNLTTGSFVDPLNSNDENRYYWSVTFDLTTHGAHIQNDSYNDEILKSGTEEIRWDNVTSNGWYFCMQYSSTGTSEYQLPFLFVQNF